LIADLAAFRSEHQIDRLVVVNLASTEPPIQLQQPAYRSLAELEHGLDHGQPGELRPGALYAYAAFESGAAFLNFTPSNSSLCPAIEELAAARGLPYMGSDGKTGETLVKSALAPMFKYRNLLVHSWLGYNILGNRDGQVLADGENKASKIGSKDGVLSSILQYPLRTHVGIDYAPSLGDHKVAWDFIHFEGFLGTKMSMQFIWQGCDSILAAPLVLDLVRLADHALRRAESGPMRQLASFFKSPVHCEEHDLHRQFHFLTDYVRNGGRRGDESQR
jgi:myo-inositol-1-phosphate synthase